MGNTLDGYGKPVFDDTFNLPEDLNAAVAYADQFANVRRGTAAERESLPAGKRRTGTLFVEEGTGAIWQDGGSGQWRVVVRPLTSYTPTVSGVTLSQVTVTGSFEQVGSRVRGEVLIVRNTAGSLGASVTFTLPLPPRDTTTTPRALGIGTVYLQNNTTTYQSFTRYTGGSVGIINMTAVGGSGVVHGSNLSNTYPTGSPHAAGTFYQALFDYEV